MLETLKRECLKDDVSAGDDIAGIILDLDCNESRTKQVYDLLQVEENCQCKVFASNPCFEVWFVAHFHELRGTYSGSGQVLEDLKRQLPDYDKGRDCYWKLKDHTQEATEKMTYATICEALIRDTLRNKLIVQDTADLLAQGHTPLVLTERLEHAKILAVALRPHCSHVFLLSGQGTAKEKRALLTELAAIPNDEPLAVVAIGKYAGEGFDLPRLDVLLLTMPVVWKGTLTQYTGRLHRATPGKREVLLYDYVDFRVPMLEQQYRKRLRSYAALAYTVRGTIGDSNPNTLQPSQTESSAFIELSDFSRLLAQDLDATSKEALFCVPSLSAQSVHRMTPILQRLQHRGVNVQVYLPQPALFRSEIQPKITANVTILQQAGISVVFSQNHLSNFCVLDQHLVWYGGLNPLGRMPAEESNLRIVSPEISAELVDFLRRILPKL